MAGRIVSHLSWVIGLAAIVWFAANLILPMIGRNEISASELVRLVNAGQVRELSATDRDIAATTADGKRFHALKEPGNTALTTLEGLGAGRVQMAAIPKVTFESPSPLAGFWAFLAKAIFVTLLGLFGVGGAIAAFQKSQEADEKRRAGEIVQGGTDGESPKVGWDEVAGAADAKQALQENSRFFRSPELLRQVGARMRRGVLLVGPPGTGKTLLARALASDVGAKFFPVSGSAFVELYVGLGAQRVRELFAKAKAEPAAVIFIDEIDAIGRRRSSQTGSGGMEYDHALNQLLVELDGFEKNPSIMVVAATNRADVLDDALLRPGRFDLIVELKLPTFEERYELLRIHAASRQMGVTWNDEARESLARQTVGFSGAEIETILNEAGLATILKGSVQIEIEDVIKATQKIAAVVKVRRLKVRDSPA